MKKREIQSNEKYLFNRSKELRDVLGEMHRIGLELSKLSNKQVHSSEQEAAAPHPWGFAQLQTFMNESPKSLL